ncbi:MAG: hypothetical protein JWQ71_3683 [Pedosphaera sp.]|nr:hypothetical protein [Pedosphaera sp.]
MAGFFCVGVQAQAPNFQWVRPMRGRGNVENIAYFNTASALTMDAQGNCYVTGLITTPKGLSLGVPNYVSQGVFLAKYSSAGEILWVHQPVITSNLIHGLGLAVDSLGNSYVAGSFSGTNIFSGTNGISNDGRAYGAFIAKYDSSGKPLWARRSEGENSDFGLSVGVDPSGNCFFAGIFRSRRVTFGSFTLTNSQPVTNNYDRGMMFLAKFDSSGNVLWARQAGPICDAYWKLAMAVDSRGCPHLVGSLKKGAAFGDIQLTNSSAGLNVFVAKYDGSGKVLWAKAGEGKSDGAAMGVAVDASENSYVTGYFISTNLSIGGITLSNSNFGPPFSQRMFIAKYNAMGNVVWAKQDNGDGQNPSSGIAVDGQGNSYITGALRSDKAIFGDIVLERREFGLIPGYVAKYDSAGQVLWVKSFGGALEEEGQAIAVDNFGTLYLAGRLSAPQAFFDKLSVMSNSYGLFVAKLGGRWPY